MPDNTDPRTDPRSERLADPRLRKPAGSRRPHDDSAAPAPSVTAGGHTDIRPELRAELQRSGYYPDLIFDTIDGALAGERALAHVVQQETTLDDEVGVRRHVTVLALTPSRMLICHTDEQGPTEFHPFPHALTTTEAVPLSRVSSVALTTVVADPAQYRPDVPPREATMVVGWGAVGRVDLEPASCGDDACEADHGYTGTVVADDLSLRVSADVDGADVVARTVAFAAALSRAGARGRG